MALLSPLFEEANSYSATQLRELIDAVFPQGGIITPGDLAVTQRGAGVNRSVDVAVGKCVVVGSDVSGQGKYLCDSTAVTNVAIATAPSTGNSRIDLIVAQVRDSDAIGGSNNDWIITAVTGTPATTGTQVAPSAPASSLVLAHVAVGPSVTTIVNANISAPPGSASAGTLVSGVLGSVYTTTGSLTTFLTTASLAAGKWLIFFTGSAQLNSGALGDAAVSIAQGTATAAFPGITSSVALLVSGPAGQIPVSFTAEADISAAGTLVFQAQGTNAEIIASGATGYSALKVG